MKNIIFADFRKRTYSHDQATAVILGYDSIQDTYLQDLGYTLKHFESKSYSNIAARFGDNQPSQGTIYKQKYLIKKGFLYIDSYGYGCTSNCELNPFKKELQSKNLWNRPMPMPADLREVYQHLIKFKKAGGERVKLGLKSDPFAWMDQKYKVSKEILSMIGSLGLACDIFTMSDLIASNDYIELLKSNFMVTFFRPDLELSPCRFGDKKASFESHWNEISPGAASLKRQDLAIQKLKSGGVFATTSKVWVR